MIPPLVDGRLPPGEWEATWEELTAAFGTTPWRNELLAGCRRALLALKAAGCRRAWIDGSFATDKDHPADIDGCYDPIGVDPGRLHPALRDLSPGRPAQKAEFGCEFFPNILEAGSGMFFVEFFQHDRNGDPKADRRHRPGGLAPMIKNERQYRITRSRADQARTTISELAHTELPDGLDPAMRQLQIEALRSTLADLETELAEYQTLHTTTLIEAAGLDQLPVALIRARIARGLTQRQLAERIGLPEQAIQRYEATDYTGVSFARLVDIAHALELTVHSDVRLAETG